MSSKELNQPEKKLIAAIEKNDAALLKTLLIEKKQDVNILDEHLMSPLQHACYKGNKEMVQMLLDQGADVNLCEHEHSYTALHFAGLSGNVDVCNLLLLAGAKANTLNTVGRNAAQMAAFVGNHNCVATINNFIPKSEIDYYTKIQGQQTKPHLPPFLCDSVHKFVMQVNVHPCRIALNLQNIPGLVDHSDEVKSVLELMSAKSMKGKEADEVMAFKLHYLSYVTKEISKIHQSKRDDEAKSDIFELFTRKLLKPGKDGNLDFMDNFLRECVREFPFRDCTIFRQMVTSLASKDPPSALSVVTAAINGQRGFIDTVAICSTCGEENPAKKCSKCKAVQYCDRNCQRLHWFVHKKACSRLSQGGVEAEHKPNPSEISAEMQNLLVKDG